MLDSIKISQSLADKVAELIAEEGNAALKLRVYVTGGGCSGLQYGFTFDANQEEDDFVFVKECSDGRTNINVIIDAISYPYLKQAEIDFVDDIDGERFVIRNPNAKTTCGCGSSFSVDD